MPLNIKEKELVAFGASIAAGCKPCTMYHIKKTRAAGVSDEELRQAVANAVCVRNSAKEIMENLAHKQLGNVLENNSDDCGCSANTTRIKELISIAAAFAVNCTTNLNKHIVAAQEIGVTNNEIKLVLDLTLSIKRKAASHVDRIAEKIGKLISSEESEDSKGCGCDDEPAKSDKVESASNIGCGC